MNAELYSEAVARGVYLFQRGWADFSKWSRAMVYEFGEPIRPHLDRIWLNAQDEWQRRQTAAPVLPLSGQPEPEQSSEQKSRPLLSEKAAPRDKANYFVRHWHGELPLAVSYWLNAFLACVPIAILGGCFSALNESVSLKASVAMGILLYILSIALSVWQIVGTWRSASKHVGRGGSAAWAATAKVFLVLGVVNLVRLTASTIFPQIVEYSNILAGDTKLPPYEIRVLPGGNEVEFSGGIRAGSAKELERILSAVPQAKVLHVNSTGGRFHEAKDMAKLVRNRGLTTYTSEECLSAATFVFIAGKERVVGARGKLGFHRGSLPGMTELQRRACEESNREIMRSAGVSDDFINHVLATAPENMWYPSVEELRHAGVITSQSFGERFAVSGALLRYSSSDDAESAFDAVPVFRVLRRLEPRLYQKMLSEFSAAIQAGKSEGEAINIARGLMEPLVLKYLPTASDEALVAMRECWVKTIELLKDKDSRVCIAAFSLKSAGTNYNYNFASLLPKQLTTNLLTAVEKVFLSASELSAHKIDALEAENYLTDIKSKLNRVYGDDLDLLAKEDDWLKHSDRVSEMLLALYRETQKIPAERQGNLLRYMLSGLSATSSRPQQAVDKRADPTGTWTWSTPGLNGGPERKCILKLNLQGEQVTGRLSAPGSGGQMSDLAISEGRLQDGEISFAVSREFQGNKITAKYNGKISGDSIKGKIGTERNGQALSRDWEAKRVPQQLSDEERALWERLTRVSRFNPRSP